MQDSQVIETPRPAKTVRAPRRKLQQLLVDAMPGDTAWILVPVTVRQRLPNGQCLVIGDNINRRIYSRELVRESTRFPGTFTKGGFQ